jgi:hypothetical protein
MIFHTLACERLEAIIASGFHISQINEDIRVNLYYFS